MTLGTLNLRDDARRVFGAYVSELREPPKATGGAAGPEGHLFYGSGETFLLALGEMKLPPVPERVVTPPSAPTSPKRADLMDSIERTCEAAW